MLSTGTGTDWQRPTGFTREEDVQRLQQTRIVAPVGPSIRGSYHPTLAGAALLALGITALAWSIGAIASGPDASPRPGGLRASTIAAERAYGRLPLRFEANGGQVDSRVRFIARGAGYTLFLTPQESVLSLLKPAGHAREARTGSGTDGRPTGAPSGVAIVRMRLDGASPHPRIEGLGRLPGATNYLIGRNHRRWQTGVAGYARVQYGDVYPGVGLVYYGRQGRLEYDFRVAPGANPGVIAFRVSGSRGLTLDRSGNLVIATAAGPVRELLPVAYQSVAGQRRPVAGRYVLGSGGRVRFALGAYDHRRALVIDPALAYSTYLGGGTGGQGLSVIAVDSTGAAYVAGLTNAVDFPVTAGAFQTTRRGAGTCGPCLYRTDAFVTKLNPAGSAVVYSTYVGGFRNDGANAIAVDSSGRAYITGNTSSTDFPTTANAPSPTDPGTAYQNAFVSVLKPDGSGLVYSTYLGSQLSQPSAGSGIAVDSSGRAYVTGSTSASDFPTKAPAPATPFQASPGDTTGAGDAFVAKLNPDASTGSDSLVYSTYLGGSDADAGVGIAVDQAGDAYVTGNTRSSDFPTLNPFQSANTGNGDVFVTKLNPTGSALVYSTYLGGSSSNYAAGIALDPTGHAYVTGSTLSTDFPVTSGAFQTEHAGDPATDNTYDAYVTKFAADGQSVAYSTYLGGPNNDQASGIAVTASGTAYVGGGADLPTTVSAPGDFPTVDPVAPAATGGDAFVTAIKPDGSGLSFSSYLGGGGEDLVGGESGQGGVALDGAGNVYLAGTAVSTDFPTLNAVQPRTFGHGLGDNRETFVVKLAPVDPAAPLVTGLGRRSGPAGTPEVITGHGFAGAIAVSFGTAAASSFTVDSDTQITATAPPGLSGTIPVTVTTPQGTSPPNPISMFASAQGIWDLTGSMSLPRREGQTATLLSDGRVLVAGGRSEASIPRAAAELYDPASGTWTRTQSMGAARHGFTATLLLSGKVLVAGGTGPNGTLSSAELYDPASGTWSATGSMAYARTFHTATLLPNGNVLVVGGDGASATAELYDPASGSWSTAAPMASARSHHTATLLANGKVLVVGGASAELYDPVTNSWAATGSPVTPRRFHTATRLSDGRVLVTGGSALPVGALTSTEIYDPATGIFSSSGDMAEPRMGAAAVLLADGRVLVAGGSEVSSDHHTAELYDPGTGRWSSAGVMNRYRGFALDGQMVFAVPLATGKVLVGGDAQSAGATTELYDPSPVFGGLPGSGSGPGSGGSGQSVPFVQTGRASRVGRHGATVAGLVNPEGGATTYWFQYGAKAFYGLKTTARPAGAGSTSVAVSAVLGGLRAGTTYHYRIVAANAQGTTYGGDATFRTLRARVRPRGLSVSVSPHHAVVLPYRFRVSGRLSLPRGVRAKQGCKGRVSVQVRRGRETVSSRRVGLSRRCGYSSTVRFTSARLPGRGRLKVSVRFLGNRVLVPLAHRPIFVLYG